MTADGPVGPGGGSHGSTVPVSGGAGSAGQAVLVSGGTGFVGTAVLRALAADARLAPGAVRALVRRVPAPERRVAGVTYLTGDLTDPRTLRGTCDGVRSLVHCASLISGDEAACTAVNVDGTRALLAEADRAGVRRTVQLSTTAVYGAGPHRDLAEDAAPTAPASPTSRTRLLAESAVRAAGGVVVRPPLVYGPGDVWVVPLLAELLRRVPALVGHGRARLSVVAVADLGRLLATLALDPAAVPEGSVHHAGHPDPVTLRDLVRELGRTVGLPVPEDGLDVAPYLERLAAVPGRASAHQARLLAEDRWYRSDVWALAGCPVGPGLATRLREAAPWYRERLAAAVTPV
ncbi:NAD-dependent epimerase/dehydratase family protein [Streptomyces flavalbus]|uniref:NAD-dependent epimerase/dehydratase family protein n=1 Tax=Streptomyces flavalbus TaxID=2665155 RepID=A0ABW2WBK3_9ACTN